MKGKRVHLVFYCPDIRFKESVGLGLGDNITRFYAGRVTVTDRTYSRGTYIRFQA